MARPVGNPNIKDHASKGGKSLTPMGQFRRSLSNFNRKNIPEEMLELFDWCKGLNTKEIDYLLELKNISELLKTSVVNDMLKRYAEGKPIAPTRAEMDQLKLIVDILDKSHKLKYGDRKVIERIVTYDDVRDQIFKPRKILNAKFIQDDNRGSNGTELPSED